MIVKSLTSTGKLVCFDAPSGPPPPPRFLAPFWRSDPQRGRSASGPGDSAPPHRDVQIAPILGGICARNGVFCTNRPVLGWTQTRTGSICT